MPSSTPTEMRFSANFFYRNYPSPFAWHWQPTKMLLSISSPRWRTTWPRCKALNHQFITFRKKMTPKLQPYNTAELLKISKMLQSRSTHEQRPSHSQSSICWYHERFGSNAKKCREPCEFRAQPGNSTPSRLTRPTRLAALNFSAFLIRTPNCIS